MVLDIFACLIQQQFKLVLIVGTAEMLEEGALLALVLHHLDGSCPRCGLHRSDCQVSTHGGK